MTARVSNPLTVVAIFAGLAEAFAAIALINIPNDIQQIFVFFVMAFPVLIVLLFFAVLNWNHTVLYAPGDFQDEGMYLESIRLKDSLKSEIIGSLTTQNSNNSGLTEKQIREVSEKVDRVIDEAGLLSRKQQILTFLSEGPATVGSISQSLNLNQSYAYRLLGSLADERKIVQQRSGRSVQWSLLDQERERDIAR